LFFLGRGGGHFQGLLEVLGASVILPQL
jgi:hypothetical protein